MSGKVFVYVFVGIALVFGIGLYYSLVYAYYETTDGLSEITVQDREIAISDYIGIDATSSGLKLRGCFTVKPSDFDGLALGVDAVPLSAPKWFDCYNVGDIHQDIEAGRAIAYLAAENEKGGIDRIVAVYPDGRAFQWRQFNEKYQD